MNPVRLAYHPDDPEALDLGDEGLDLGASSGASVGLGDRSESSMPPLQVYPRDVADGITTPGFRASREPPGRRCVGPVRWAEGRFRAKEIALSRQLFDLTRRVALVIGGSKAREGD